MTVSPKRKRGPSDPATPTPFAPRINTSAFPGPGPATSDGDPHTAPLPHASVGSESPRTSVARQFGHLQLEPGAALPKIDFGNTPAADSSSMNAKKAKHMYEQPGTVGHGAANGRHGFGHHRHAASYSPPPQPVLEIAETPQSAFGNHVSQAALRQQQLSPPTPSSSPSVKLFLSGGRRQNDSKLRAPSPPPDPESSATSPAATVNPSPVDPSNLTWQESEITGHLIDKEREDDGYGINGVGFRPTHAVAQQRVLRRRQQILEWRAREAREARQKRSERRRLGASISERNMGGEVPKRVVRFAS
ncbi:uncharacterized protein J3D65DRAFT_641863 [Phyllosticta citribraziliensis]|uniref:Uncharacterized protein n=1 Tax=Phyllosticta citribraziliensis TaxID=989973 RepID=A0ABR1L431_9PEZI